MFKERFEYNRKIVNLISVLSRNEYILQSEPNIKKQGLWLKKNAMIKTITYSNQIEGNSLRESEVATIIAGKKVKGLKKDIIEAKNLHNAYGTIETLAKESSLLTKSDVLNLHKILCKGTVLDEKQLGNIRTIEVFVGDPETNEVIYKPPAPTECRELLDQFFIWLKNEMESDDFEPYITAALAHYYLVTIHPFIDGNGRISRLLQNYILRKGNLHFSVYIPVETAIKKHQQKYYDVLEITRKKNDLNVFVTFVLEMIKEEGEKLINEIESLPPVKGSKTELQEDAVLLMLGKRKSIKASDVISELDVSKPTATRIFERMMKKKLIQRFGSGASSYYTRLYS